MTEWTTVILEAYCLRTAAGALKKSKHFTDLQGNKIKNRHYDPKFKTPRKPSYCPGMPQYICLEKNCPFFTFGNASEEEYLHDNLYWKKKK